MADKNYMVFTETTRQYLNPFSIGAQIEIVIKIIITIMYRIFRQYLIILLIISIVSITKKNVSKASIKVQ